MCTNNSFMNDCVLDRARDLENLATTLQTHCDQLQNELISMKDKYAQSVFEFTQ